VVFAFMDLPAHATAAMWAILLHALPMNGPIYRTIMESYLVPSGAIWRFGQRTIDFTNGPVVCPMSSPAKSWQNMPAAIKAACQKS
jgi:hypothetical protein